MTNWMKRTLIRHCDRDDYNLLICSKKNNMIYSCELTKDEFKDLLCEIDEDNERIIIQNKVEIL